MNEKIYLSAPDVGELEQGAVHKAIQSGWVAPLGPEVDAFEEEVASRIGVKHAVALSSGTAALHLGLLALGVKPGDIVITSTMTFVATANAILYTGAKPFFVDSEEESGNISPRLLLSAIQRVLEENKHIGAILPVDLLGKAINYTEIINIAKEFNIPVLCDAAESLGASHKGKNAGSWGDASIVSFNGNKIMTTSGGGMFLTDQKQLAEQVRYLATQARKPVVHYEHSEMGFNYRLSNILAALGRAQLSRLNQMITSRRRWREVYKEIFSGVKGVQIFGGEDDVEDNCWLTAILVNPQVAGWTSASLMRHLAESNIETRPLWKPMHLQPLFQDTGCEVDGTSEYLFDNGLTLPSGSGMSEKQISFVSKKIHEFLKLQEHD